ncbi:MAG: precorrin-4 C(11)-methyltransferase [Desulfovibrio sp.]|jgi:precorrin-4/cobalt-precorrin-4 C11-methyltransferase|nr:precorrin-4 C(11)-methyltransferase [Desulfovibrio sp.]
MGGAKTGYGRGMVWFVGAGPGDPELITVKGRRLIAEADLVLYTGSLVPCSMVACAKPGARVEDSSGMTLEETHARIRRTVLSGLMVARVHTGDPMLYGAVREQMRLLDRDGIHYAVVPGVSAVFAAAAAAGVSLTVPERVQSLVVTRLEGRTPVPAGQRVADYVRHGASLAVYLSAASPEALAEELRRGGAEEDVPVLLAHRVGLPDEKIVPTTLRDLEETARGQDIGRQTVFLVLPGERLGESPPSRLYARDFTHGRRQ